jgi:ATPase subunit of ABC transporter with duplicated ATPase domains
MRKTTIDGKKYKFEFIIRKTGKHEVFEYEKRYSDEDRYWGKKDLRRELKKANAFIRKYSRYIMNDVYPKKSITSVKLAISPITSSVETSEIKSEKVEKSIDEKISESKGVSVGEVEYIMPKKESQIVLSSLKRGKNLLLVGASGCGKSKMILELAKQEGKTVSRLPLNGGCTDASFIGE